MKADRDALGLAHLALRRGKLDQARDLVQSVLLGEPDNRQAQQLLRIIEEKTVEHTVCARESEGWVSRMQPSRLELLGITAGGMATCALAAWWAADPLSFALRHGMAATTTYRTGPIGVSTCPVHFLLLGPLVLGTVGSYILASVAAFLRSRS